MNEMLQSGKLGQRVEVCEAMLAIREVVGHLLATLEPIS
jgi:hypothetical protein